LRQTTWEELNDLENSEDHRSAGGYGNQHVRLRGAQINVPKRSARLDRRCFEPWQTSCERRQTDDFKQTISKHQADARTSATGPSFNGVKRTKMPRRIGPACFAVRGDQAFPMSRRR
jgi:hypothetical protein